jgi:glyoxylase-like metal-dependent hydrolase (beta-lactamase superfamily II)
VRHETEADVEIRSSLLPDLVMVHDPEFRAYTGPVEIVPGKVYRVQTNRPFHSQDAEGHMIIADGITIIDPGSRLGLHRLEANLKRLGFALPDIRRIILTHAHGDHGEAAGIIQSMTNAELWVHKAAKQIIEDGDAELTAEYLYGRAPAPARVDRILHDGETEQLDGTTLRFHHTPGHSPDGLTIEATVNNAHLLLVGDCMPNTLHGDRLQSVFDQRQTALNQIEHLAGNSTIILSGHDLPLTKIDFQKYRRQSRPQTEGEFRFTNNSH